MDGNSSRADSERETKMCYFMELHFFRSTLCCFFRSAYLFSQWVYMDETWSRGERSEDIQKQFDIDAWSMGTPWVWGTEIGFSVLFS